MDMQENKKISRRSTAVSGSLAYYNLLAGMNLARTSIQRSTGTARATQNESTCRTTINNNEVSKA